MPARKPWSRAGSSSLGAHAAAQEEAHGECTMAAIFFMSLSVELGRASHVIADLRRSRLRDLFSGRLSATHFVMS